MNKKLSYNIISVIAAIFIFLFVYTSVSKLFKMQMFKYTLSTSPLIGSWSSFVAWSIVFLEWLAALLLLYPPLRLQGLYLSLLLMSTFTVYILIMLLTASKLPCSCGGVLKQLSWTDHLFLNIGLTIIALFGVVADNKRRKYIASNKYV